MDEVTMLLVEYAFVNKGMAMCLHGWPKVASAEDSSGRGSCARVISAYGIVQFFYYVLGLFGCDSFKEWMVVSSLV